MNTRRKIISTLGFGALAWPLSSLAQQAGKVWRIGMLETVSPERNAANMDALREGLKEYGYVEGRNLVIEYRSAAGRAEQFASLVNELLALKVDVIVTRGTPATLAAKKATTTVPIVAAAIGEPLLAVATLSKPGANVTGLSSLSTDLEGKRVELIKEVFPGVRRIAGLMNMSNPVHSPQWREMERAALTLKLQPQLLDVVLMFEAPFDCHQHVELQDPALGHREHRRGASGLRDHAQRLRVRRARCCSRSPRVDRPPSRSSMRPVLGGHRPHRRDPDGPSITEKPGWSGP